MAVTLRAIEATVSADGVVTFAEPIIGPAKAFITVLVDEWTPNAETLAAMNEPVEGLPRYKTMEDIRATLGI
jgi:hypothetical protein